VQTEVAFPDVKPMVVEGQVGVGTWDSTAEFKDVRVEKAGQVLSTSDFAKDTEVWRPDRGRWAVEDGVYRQTRRGQGLSYLGDETWTDYTLTLKARKLSGNEGFLIVFGRKGTDRYWWNLGGWGNGQHAIEFNQNPVGRPVQGRIEENRWYDIKVELNGRRIRCSLDGQLIHDVNAPSTQKVFAVAGPDQASGDIILKAINTVAEPMSANLTLSGVQIAPAQAAVTVLTAASLRENNSLDEPHKVMPQTSTLGVSDPQCTVELRPYSLTVIRFKTQGDPGPFTSGRPATVPIDPPEKAFFAKRLDFQGIPIKAPKEVMDEALYAAYDRLAMMMAHLPNVPASLAAAGAELHIIGRDQVTTDLPEWRQDKGKPLDEYNGLTRDQRTRGMGGLLTSCGEENLLKLENDRYRGHDICVHEFSHNILDFGVAREVRRQFETQRKRSLKAGLWVKSYAGSNTHEFFAELAMWYFGTHGDLHMEGKKLANGPEGLKAYDPEAYALVDNFWSGRILVPSPDRD
jgi:hypothetical protein